MKELPLLDPEGTLVCTITEAEIPERIETLERMRSEMTSITFGEQGMTITFPSDAEELVTKFTVDEKRCCGFWNFDVSTSQGQTVLKWEGPPAAGPIIGAFRSFFQENAPAESLLGFL